jgi:hypothetical protein
MAVVLNDSIDLPLLHTLALILSLITPTLEF